MNSPSFLNASALVALGGGFGAWCRYATGIAWSRAIGPVSLLMGLLVGWLARFGNHGEGWRLLLGVGVLGGYTTFSSFALEFALFVERGALGLAALYVGLSLAAGFAALFLGLMVIRGLA